jgi:hypothetical protein
LSACGIKQYHSLFPKHYIEDALKEAPGGIAIFLAGKSPMVKYLSLQLGTVTHAKQFFTSLQLKILVLLLQAPHI